MTGPLTYERLTAPARKAALRISEGLGIFPQKLAAIRDLEKLAAESVCHDIVDKAVAMFRERKRIADEAIHHTTERDNG